MQAISSMNTTNALDNLNNFGEIYSEEKKQRKMKNERINNKKITMN